MALGTDGLRGELTLIRAARALAALDGDARSATAMFGASRRHGPAPPAAPRSARRVRLHRARRTRGRGGPRRMSLMQILDSQGPDPAALGLTPRAGGRCPPGRWDPWTAPPCRRADRRRSARSGRRLLKALPGTGARRLARCSGLLPRARRPPRAAAHHRRPAAGRPGPGGDARAGRPVASAACWPRPTAAWPCWPWPSA